MGRNKFLIFLILSIGLHLASLLTICVLPNIRAHFEDTESLEITFENSNNEPPELENKADKIVDTDSKFANNKINSQSQYLSEKNNSVEKETKSKNIGKFTNAKPTQAMQVQKYKTHENLKKTVFSNSFDAYASMQKRESSKIQNSGELSTPSASSNHLEGVDEDMMTKLNTREYKYFGYYSRIKNQLNQWWAPKVQEKFQKILRQGRTIASDESKITSLVIVLNDIGNLVKIQILSESGIRDLDDAAVEAFRSAAPFPNPPKGIIETDGTVKIRWDCVVES